MGLKFAHLDGCSQGRPQQPGLAPQFGQVEGRGDPVFHVAVVGAQHLVQVGLSCVEGYPTPSTTTSGS